MHKLVVPTLGVLVIIGAIGINSLSNKQSGDYGQSSVNKTYTMVSDERKNNTNQNNAQLMVLNEEANITKKLDGIDNNNLNDYDSSYNQNPNYDPNYDSNYNQNQNPNYSHNRNNNYSSNYDRNYRNGCCSRSSDYYNYFN